MRHTPSPSPYTAPWQLIKHGSLRLAAVLAYGEQLLTGRRVKPLRFIADEGQPGKIKRPYWQRFISVGIAAFLCGAAPALAQTALGTAQSFAVLGPQR
jgi:hypothetical protein